MLYTSDIQILKLPVKLKEDGKISSIGQFYEETGITGDHFKNVRNQEKYGRAYHFTPAQIEKICLTYGINFNWVFAQSDEIYTSEKVTKSVTKQ